MMSNRSMVGIAVLIAVLVICSVIILPIIRYWERFDNGSLSELGSRGVLPVCISGGGDFIAWKERGFTRHSRIVIVGRTRDLNLNGLSEIPFDRPQQIGAYYASKNADLNDPFYGVRNWFPDGSTAGIVRYDGRGWIVEILKNSTTDEVFIWGHTERR